MENPSHSHSHSKKSSNNVYPGKTVYDDVFGGPPKFGVPTLSPRLEDYKEIFEKFQSSRPSSIPVLDLPIFKEEEEDLSFDVQSSNFDYSQVFGGFNSLDFAVPYQDLFKQTKPRDDSSDEDWTPAQSESLSDESEPSASFEKNQNLPNEDPHQSINDTKQFNISYNMSNSKGKEDILNGMTCVTHLQAVPGFTFVVNETPPSRKTEEESSNLRVTNGLNLSRDFGGGPHTEGRQLRKTMSQPSNSNFVSLSNISLRTQPSDLPPPSRPPPGLAVKRGNSDGLKSKLRVTKSCTFERESGESSPPYFDVEIDASSSAAASAAAMKDAVEKAQAKLRSAKELMERKKDGQSRSKLRLESHIKNQEKNVTESFDRPSSYEGEKVKGTCEREFSVMKPYAGEERGKVMKKSHVYSDTVEEERYINVAAQRVCEWEENVNILGVAQQHREIKKTLNEADKSKELENLRENQLKENQVEAIQKLNEADEEIETDEIFEDAHESKENDTRRSIGTFKRQEYERELKESTERAENEKRVKESLELEENEKQQQDAREREENEKKQKEAREREENEKKQKEADEREENEKKQKEARERAENEKQQKEAHKKAENEKKQREAREREDNEKQQKEARKRAENEKKQKEAREREENKMKQKEAREREENEKKQKEARERKENEMKQKVAREREENEKKQKEAREREENEMKQKEASEKEDYEKKQKEAHEREESDKKQKEACEIGEKEKRLEEALDQEGNEKRSKEAFEEELACERGQNEKLLRGALKQEENKNNLKEAIQQKENAKVAEKAYEGETNEKRLNDAREREENDQRFKEGGHCVIEESEKNAQVVFKEEGNEERSKGVSEGDETDDRVKYADNLEGLSGENDDQGQADKEDNERKLNSDEKIYAHQTEPNCEEADGACKLDDDETPHVTRVAEEHVTNNGKMGTTQDALSCEEDGKVRTKPKGCERELEVVEGKVKGKSTNASQKVNSHSLERKEKNLNETRTRRERKNEERVKRERELENDRLRKIEEEREREREREKDRMAVDRAIHEARERVFAEARERAERAAVERATAEFRQRAMAEARERLEKATTEARLRAERVAVEKATAEARERAVEKAMAERSVADKFSVSSRSGGVRQNSSSSDLQDPQFQGVVSSCEARPVNSSVHGGVEDESPQRCKARLERHRRTAERAAKALAEKNMRDLLTQREQTERNRLAETLDAEVKRWSSGKEGNLRALLSTLQYILGPDSGWQPIPLTDVITTVAVKKAYRKATLCVHPDKLQQRGASIHQKYICEKVFDLLKEAWHKYNSEER